MRSIDELETLRARLLDEVRARPEPIRTRAAAPGEGWTPVQVLQHLLLVETLILSRIVADAGDRGSSGEAGRRADLPRRTLRDRVGALAVSLAFLLRMRIRMPTRRVDPVPALPFEEVDERWTRVGAELGAALREAATQAPGRPVMRHPISGPLTPAGTAAFLLKHMRHHQRQLRRILAANGSLPNR